MTSERQSGNVQGILLAAWLLLFVVVVVVMTLKWLGRMPTAIADVAPALDHLFRFILAVAGAIFLLAHLYLLFVVWRFRSGNGNGEARFGLERRHWRWVLVPAALILVADMVFDHKSNHIWAHVFWQVPKDAFVVEVTGQQFAWNLRYPGKDGKFGRTSPKLITEDNTIGIDTKDPASQDDIFFPAGQGESHIPLNRPVVFLLRSRDVLHSFFVPFARLKIDAVPGMTTRLWFKPTKTGTYEFACAELCGLGHYKMRGVLVVESSEALEKWMAEQSTVKDLLAY